MKLVFTHLCWILLWKGKQLYQTDSIGRETVPSQTHCSIWTTNWLVDRFKENIKLQNICGYSLTNLILIQRTRSNDHRVTDSKALIFNTHRQRVDFDTFWSTFNWSTFWHRGSMAAFFWPTTLRACIVRVVIGTYSALQPYVAGKSNL